jgi:2-polyprenyl-6-hydroxyphenyl methylase/3-demethylubiquinone-9 3-methyltransferase
MTSNLTHEVYVAQRFDDLQSRFKTSLDAGDYRLRGVLEALGPLAGRRVLDLGCGKGRFARALSNQGARVVALDLAAGMLAQARGMDRVRASAKRLPFGPRTFDAVVAVEVFEHLEPVALEGTLDELRRVLRPGGLLAIVDKNVAALDANRPWLPSLLVKRIDEQRGRWMYPAGGPVRERWFWPPRLRALLRERFEGVRLVRLLSPAEERRWLFRRVEATRLMTLWAAKAPGGLDV